MLQEIEKARLEKNNVKKENDKIKEKVQFMNNFADYDKIDPDDFSIKL